MDGVVSKWPKFNSKDSRKYLLIWTVQLKMIKLDNVNAFILLRCLSDSIVRVCGYKYYGYVVMWVLVNIDVVISQYGCGYVVIGKYGAGYVVNSNKEVVIWFIVIWMYFCS